MIDLVLPVKFLEVEHKNGEKNGKPWSITEAVLFVNDVGRVKVAVYERDGEVKLPEPGQMVKLRLSVSIGSFQAIKPVWDKNSVFTVVSPALSKAA